MRIPGVPAEIVRRSTSRSSWPRPSVTFPCATARAATSKSRSILLLATALSMLPGTAAADGVYIRAGAGLDRSNEARFTDADCSTHALYGCDAGTDGAPHSAVGDFGAIAGGVDPVSWRPNPVARRRYPRCRRPDRRTRRRSAASRWSSWFDPDERRGTWLGSSSPRPRRFEPGWRRPTETPVRVTTACTSMDGSKPAIYGHLKTGHFRRPETGVEIYFTASSVGKVFAGALVAASRHARSPWAARQPPVPTDPDRRPARATPRSRTRQAIPATRPATPGTVPATPGASAPRRSTAVAAISGPLADGTGSGIRQPSAAPVNVPAAPRSSTPHDHAAPLRNGPGGCGLVRDSVREVMLRA